MGSADSKLNFRKAVIQLTTKTQPVEATDDAFWDQFWADTATSVQDVFALVPAAEIRAVREESPSNLATLCYKAVEKLVQGAESGCHSEKEKQIVLNCSRLLTRVLPYIFEDPDWRGFFWSTVPGAGRGEGEDDDENARPLAESLLLAIADLLFCPEFTVQSHRRSTVDLAEDMHSLDSCEYIWEAGVGFAHSPQPNYIHDTNRTELLKLLLTCFSEAMYLPPAPDSDGSNPWVQFFCSTENRHALPLFTSLLNTVCAYDPVGYGIPYNHLLFSTTWFLFSAAQNHHLVFFLLEVFNNIIQYQFDGNSNLVYAIIRKRSVFHQLANLPSDPPAIHKALQRRRKAPEPLSRSGSQEGASMEGSRPAAPAEPGTLKTSLVATPGIDKLTEKSQVSEDGTLRSLEPAPPQSPEDGSPADEEPSPTWREQRRPSSASASGQWSPTPEWVLSWKAKLPLQTIMRLLQVLVPQVEKICIDKGLTDESEILRFLQHGTLVGLLPVPHPILIRKYQANSGTAMWFRTYMWGVIYLRNVDPPVWYDTDVKLFEIQRV
uniref:HID1 domain containing n=1 Tax=Pipistrellus kuhlii TaxID=59472 RepID=A0A7J7SEH8_PIPKU|nr:HID1 domain containing [Pipistrellus kuhlii]